MKILTEDKKPICERQKRFSLVVRETINKQVRQYLDNDIIRWSTSDFTRE